MLPALPGAGSRRRRRRKKEAAGGGRRGRAAGPRLGMVLLPLWVVAAALLGVRAAAGRQVSGAPGGVGPALPSLPFPSSPFPRGGGPRSLRSPARGVPLPAAPGSRRSCSPRPSLPAVPRVFGAGAKRTRCGLGSRGPPAALPGARLPPLRAFRRLPERCPAAAAAASVGRRGGARPSRGGGGGEPPAPRQAVGGAFAASLRPPQSLSWQGVAISRTGRAESGFRSGSVAPGSAPGSGSVSVGTAAYAVKGKTPSREADSRNVKKWCGTERVIFQPSRSALPSHLAQSLH